MVCWVGRRPPGAYLRVRPPSSACQGFRGRYRHQQAVRPCSALPVTFVSCVVRLTRACSRPGPHCSRLLCLRQFTIGDFDLDPITYLWVYLSVVRHVVELPSLDLSAEAARPGFQPFQIPLDPARLDEPLFARPDMYPVTSPDLPDKPARPITGALVNRVLRKIATALGWQNPETGTSSFFPISFQSAGSRLTFTFSGLLSLVRFYGFRLAASRIGLQHLNLVSPRDAMFLASFDPADLEPIVTRLSCPSLIIIRS